MPEQQHYLTKTEANSKLKVKPLNNVKSNDKQ